MRSLSILCLAALTLAPLQSQAPNTDAGSTWKKLEFMLGKWTGSAAADQTPLGAGQGGFSFESELNGKIIVRRNHAGYDSGVSHDDLMIIYLDADAPRAIYFDTEGHVIHYRLSFPAPNRVIFESEAADPGPRYRLTYWLTGAALDGKFEMAPPGSEYKPYMSWTSKRN